MLQIRLSPSELRTARAVAKARGVGVSDLVRSLVGRAAQANRRAKSVNA